MQIAHLPAAQGSPLIVTDEDRVIALLRNDFMGGAEQATSAVDAFLHGIATSGKFA